jgi:heat shock protein HslJ/uncharacterized membrane protein
MKAIAAFPLVALALTACVPYGYGNEPGPYPQDPQGYPQPGYPPYPDTGYPQGGPPMPPGGPVYPGPGQPTNQAPAYPSGQTTYRAIGTEPFWDLEIGRELIFTDRGNNVSVSDPAPTPINGVAGETYRTSRLEVNIVHRQCNDGMSDRSYPDTVDVRVDGRQRYRGCGAPIEYFSQTAETGQQGYPAPSAPYGQPGYPAPSAPPYGQPYPGPSVPPGQPGYPGPGGTYGQPGYGAPGAPHGMPVANLTGTNWRVLSINGTRTPASNFYLNFMPDQVGAKFGCNSLSATYIQSGSSVRFGPVAATRMACPDMNFEQQGSQILGQPVTVSGFGNRITLSNARGSIELVQAR